MAFFDNVGKKISTAADLAVDKAKDLAETGKTKLDIATEEKEIKELYAKIGEAVFLLEKDNAATAAPFYLLNGAVLKNDVKAGNPVTTDDVDLSGLATYELFKKGLELK